MFEMTSSTEKRMIFHIPNHLDENRKSGSQIRPLKMIEAFKNNGYIVDTVMGYGKDRKKSIERIKTNISEGIIYDFLYSESSTMPTLLTEKNHLPLYPNLDFAFFKFCKKNGIKIGLFYRDVYWKFDFYKKNMSTIKRIIATWFYKYDLKRYNSLLDIFYVVTNGFKRYVDNNIKCKIELLPPGCENKNVKTIKKNGNLNIFYVGGISKDVYNLKLLFKVVSELNNIDLNVCCRMEEWEKVREDYQPYLTKNINIVHKSGKELEPYFEKADVCNLFFKPSSYMNIAIPIKTMEYISNRKPIIATEGTEASNFVKENDIGFSIDYNEKELKELLIKLSKNKELINEKVKNINKIFNNNTWEARARKVESDLAK